MDVNDLRDDLILAHNLNGVDDVYTFYYDETNNIRKFHLVEDGFNVNDPGNFVLAGVLHKGIQYQPDIDELLKRLNLQKTTKEIKLKHVGKGDFEKVISSQKLSIILK